jgi:endoglucanase
MEHLASNDCGRYRQHSLCYGHLIDMTHSAAPAWRVLLAVLAGCWLAGFWLPGTIVSPVAAEPMRMQRGIATEPWTTWPGEAEWTPAALTPFPEWRRFADVTALQRLKAAGFDFVRLALDPAPVLAPTRPMSEATFVAETKASLRLIQSAGLNVIVDLHAIPVTPGWRPTGTQSYLQDAQSFGAYVDLIEQVATALADEDPARVSLELMNEPTIDCPYSEVSDRWPAMLATLHRRARQAAPKLTLILSGACWGGAEGLEQLQPAAFADDNIIWSFHSYDPFVVTHQGASWNDGPESFISGLRFPPDLTQGAEVITAALDRIWAKDMTLQRRVDLIKQLSKTLAVYFASGDGSSLVDASFAKVEAWAQRNTIPASRILLGEFGVILTSGSAQTPPETRVKLIAAMRRAAEARGFAWSIWCWSGSFATVESDTDRRLRPDLLEALGLTVSDRP